MQAFSFQRSDNYSPSGPCTKKINIISLSAKEGKFYTDISERPADAPEGVVSATLVADA